MDINKESWHYKAYASTYDKDVPSVTTLCQYIRRLAIAPFFWIFGLALVAIVFVIWSIPLTIFEGLGGQKPKEGLLDIPLEGKEFTSYQLPRIVGITVYPWYLVILIFLGYLYCQHPKITLIGVGIIGVVIVVITLIIWFFNTEIWNLIKTHYDDQKKRICRRVEFVSDKPDESGKSNNPD